MWKITRINNETHEVVLTHHDGEQMSFVVPESNRFPSKNKIAYIKAQTDARDIIKAKIAKAPTRKLYVLYGLLTVETIALIALLIKVL